MQDAMRARDSVKLDTLRMLITAMTNQMKAAGRMLVDGMTDEDVVAIIRREMKKREEAGEAYLAAGRKELAEKEAEEYGILEAYTPPLMAEEEIRAVVIKEKENLGITDKKSAGILMGRVMKELQGKADGAKVKAIIDSLFS